MLLYTFASLALIATPSVFAKPIAQHQHQPNFQHPGPPASTPDGEGPPCVATSYSRADASCHDIAITYGIQLSAYEADSPSDSETCRGLLAGYKVCVWGPNGPQSTSLAAPNTTTTTAPLSSPTANTTTTTTEPAIYSTIPLTTLLPNSSSSVVASPSATEETIAITRTTTLSYYVGTGSSTTPKTIVVTHSTTEVVAVTSTTEVTVTSGYASSSASLSSVASTSSLSSFTSSSSALSSASSSFSSLSVSLSSTSASSTSTSTSSSTSSTSSTSSATSSTFSSAASTTSSTFSTSSSTLSTSSPASSTSATAPATSNATSACTGTSAPPAATQAGIVTGCTKWYVAVSGDYCSSVASRYGISVATFMAWNPAVDAPTCPDMLAGDAYCVATCGSTSTASAVLTTSSATLTGTSTSATSVASTATSSLPASTSLASVDVYKTYTGDGSVAAGWPAQSQWVDFDYMFTANSPNMQASCSQWGVPLDTATELADMKTSIQTIASTTAVDARLILATIMQESTGCVRVITTQYSVFNPGLMQSHNGTGSCNTNSAPLGLPGVVSDGTVQTPCPASEIYQQVYDGTAGTSSGDGLQQCLQKQGHTDVSMWYRAARMYNGGSIDPSGDLGKGCCTLCYASDIANRLTGWVDAAHSCNL